MDVGKGAKQTCSEISTNPSETLKEKTQNSREERTRRTTPMGPTLFAMQIVASAMMPVPQRYLVRRPLPISMVEMGAESMVGTSTEWHKFDTELQNAANSLRSTRWVGGLEVSHDGIDEVARIAITDDPKQLDPYILLEALHSSLTICALSYVCSSTPSSPGLSTPWRAQKPKLHSA